jgi:hypothetical protein
MADAQRGSTSWNQLMRAERATQTAPDNYHHVVLPRGSALPRTGHDHGSISLVAYDK